LTVFIFSLPTLNWHVISTIDPSPLPSSSGNFVSLLLRDQPLQFAQPCFINALFINLEAQPVPQLVSEETWREIKENSISEGRYRKHPRSCILLRSFSLFFGPHESNLEPQLSVERD
jgi:hypothetical protein